MSGGPVRRRPSGGSMNDTAVVERDAPPAVCHPSGASPATTADAPPELSPRRRTMVLGAMCLALVLVVAGVTMLVNALPAISEDLDPRPQPDHPGLGRRRLRPPVRRPPADRRGAGRPLRPPRRPARRHRRLLRRFGAVRPRRQRPPSPP